MTRLAVIVPTIGRESLLATLKSVVEAGAREGDEVRVVIDGGQHQWAVADRIRESGLYVGDVHVKRINFADAGNDYGGRARNAGLQWPGCDWVCYLDDDDVYLPGALTAVRAALADRDPTRPELHIFRARVNDPRVQTAGDGCLWIDRDLRIGNVSTCMLVHSLAPLAATGVRWRTDVYEHDYHYAADLVAGGYELHWQDDVIAAVRPGRGA